MIIYARTKYIVLCTCTNNLFWGENYNIIFFNIVSILNKFIYKKQSNPKINISYQNWYLVNCKSAVNILDSWKDSCCTPDITEAKKAYYGYTMLPACTVYQVYHLVDVNVVAHTHIITRYYKTMYCSYM